MTTSARAIVTIEVSGIGTWGPKCDLAQVYKQAAESAVHAIRQALIESKSDKRFEIIGEPKITAVLVTERSFG